MSDVDRPGEPTEEAGIRLERRAVAWIVLGVVALAGAALRFYRIGALPLSEDEGATVRFAAKPLAVLWGPEAGRETNPPLYYSLQRLWAVFGESEAALRSLSAVCGVLVLGLTYRLAADLAPPDRSRRTGLLAAALAAVSTAQVMHAQDARAYMLMTAAAAAVLVCFAAIVRDPGRAGRPWWSGRSGAGDRGWWLGLIGGSIVLLYSHNTAVVPVGLLQLAAVAWWAGSGRPAGFVRNWVVANGLVLLAWLWWAPKITRQAAEVLRDWWIPEPTLPLLWEAVAELFLFSRLGRSAPVAMVLVLGLAAVGFFAWRRRPWSLVLSAGMAAGGVLVLFALSFWRPMFLPRAVLWTTTPWCVLLAAGAMACRPTALRRVLVAVLLLGGARNLSTYYQYASRPPWDQVAAFVRASDGPGDLVAMVWAHHDSAFGYYYPEVDGEQDQVRRVGLVRTAAADFDPARPGLPYVVLERVPQENLPELAAGYRRVFIVANRGDEDMPASLARLGAPIEKHAFRGIRVLVYAGGRS